MNNNFNKHEIKNKQNLVNSYMKFRGIQNPQIATAAIESIIKKRSKKNPNNLESIIDALESENYKNLEKLIQDPNLYIENQNKAKDTQNKINKIKTYLENTYGKNHQYNLAKIVSSYMESNSINEEDAIESIDNIISLRQKQNPNNIRSIFDSLMHNDQESFNELMKNPNLVINSSLFDQKNINKTMNSYGLYDLKDKNALKARMLINIDNYLKNQNIKYDVKQIIDSYSLNRKIETSRSIKHINDLIESRKQNHSENLNSFLKLLGSNDSPEKNNILKDELNSKESKLTKKDILTELMNDQRLYINDDHRLIYINEVQKENKIFNNKDQKKQNINEYMGEFLKRNIPELLSKSQNNDKVFEKYTDNLINSYAEFKKINKDLALNDLNNLIQERKEKNLENLDSITEFLTIEKNYNFINNLIQNPYLYLSDKNNEFINKNITKKNEKIEEKFLMKNFKKFSNPDKNLHIIGPHIRNTIESRRIYELICKSQKLESEKNIISRMQKETDYLEKVLQSFKKYKKKDNLEIKDLKNFLDFSNNPIETMRALINLYDSNGKIGRDYLDNFAFAKNFDEIPENDPNYFQLSNDQISEKIQKAKNFSANIILSESNKSFLGSSVLYKIDKKNNIAYFLTNEHVLGKSNANNNKINVQIMNPDLEKSEYEAEIVGSSNDHDVGLIAIKLSRDDIAKMNEPKINKQVQVNKRIFLIGNSHGLGDKDFSTNVTIGNIKEQIFKEKIIYDSPSFPGNSGSGLWNQEGELIGIHKAGSENKDKIYIKNFASGVPIALASEIADKLILDYEKKHNIKNSRLSHTQRYNDSQRSNQNEIHHLK